MAAQHKSKAPSVGRLNNRIIPVRASCITFGVYENRSAAFIPDRHGRPGNGKSTRDRVMEGAKHRNESRVREVGNLSS